MQFSTFTFAQQHNVRAFEQNGLTWFVAADVCAALEIVNHKDAISKLDDDEKAETEIQTAGGKQTVRIINESGLYILILRSRKAMEKGTVQHKFRKWVTNEVLPQIRKTGSYTVSGSLKSKTAKLGCLTLAQQDEIKKFHRQLVQSAPKDKQAALAIGLWSAVKTKFGVGYKQVAEAHYPEVLSLMARVAVEKGALSGEVLDKEPELPAVALNDYELTRIAQFLSQSYSMMTELYIVQEPMNMLRLPFGQKALQYLKDNLPLLQAVVHGLQRFRPTDPICAPEFNKHMQYLSRAGLPV